MTNLSICSECLPDYIDHSSRPISCAQCKCNLPHLNKIRRTRERNKRRTRVRKKRRTRERKKRRTEERNKADFSNFITNFRTNLLYACIILGMWYCCVKWGNAVEKVGNNPHRFYPHCLLNASESHDLDLYQQKVIYQFLGELWFLFHNLFNEFLTFIHFLANCL